jgi:phosphoglycolate phosphatase
LKTQGGLERKVLDSSPRKATIHSPQTTNLTKTTLFFPTTGRTKLFIKTEIERRELIMDSIIFDLDGTLWDPTDTVSIAWNKVMKQNKQVKNEITKRDLKGTMGLQVKEIGEKLFPYLDEETREKLLSDCCGVENQYLSEQGGSLYENMEEVLKALSQKYKLYIVSNCQDGYIEAFYKYHKLDKYFLDYENPGRTGLSKGENIRLIIERNNLTKPVYVGDTEGDHKAAKYAGIPFVYARYGFGEVKDYDYAIDTVSELLELF